MHEPQSLLPRLRCKACGRSKQEHVNFSRTSAELSSKLTHRTKACEEGRPTAVTESHTQAAGPCAHFKLDLRADQFGACQCGHPKASHVEKLQTHGAGSELTRKLNKQPSTTKTISNEVEANQAVSLEASKSIQTTAETSRAPEGPCCTIA